MKERTNIINKSHNVKYGDEEYIENGNSVTQVIWWIVEPAVLISLIGLIIKLPDIVTLLSQVAR